MTELSYIVERATPGQVIEGRILSGEEYVVKFIDSEGAICDKDFFGTEEEAGASGKQWVASQSGAEEE
jgi:hypothetical protein